MELGLNVLFHKQICTRENLQKIDCMEVSPASYDLIKNVSKGGCASLDLICINGPRHDRFQVEGSSVPQSTHFWSLRDAGWVV